MVSKRKRPGTENVQSPALKHEVERRETGHRRIETDIVSDPEMINLGGYGVPKLNDCATRLHEYVN